MAKNDFLWVQKMPKNIFVGTIIAHFYLAIFGAELLWVQLLPTFFGHLPTFILGFGHEKPSNTKGFGVFAHLPTFFLKNF